MDNFVKLDRRTRAARAAQTGLGAPGQGADRRLPQVGRCKICHARDRVWGEQDEAILPEGFSVGDPLPNREALRVEVDVAVSSAATRASEIDAAGAHTPRTS